LLALGLNVSFTRRYTHMGTVWRQASRKGGRQKRVMGRCDLSILQACVKRECRNQSKLFSKGKDVWKYTQ
jgi:hypothetical protein